MSKLVYAAVASCSLRSFWGTPEMSWHASVAQASPLQISQLLPTTMTSMSRALVRPKLLSQHAALTTISGRRHLTNNGFFRVSEEVREALHSKKPVVALETTIYTHGKYFFKSFIEMVY